MLRARGASHADRMNAPEELRVIRLGPEHGEEVLRLDQAAFAFATSEMDPDLDLTTFEWDRTYAAVRRAAGPHRHAADEAWADDEELAGLMTSYSLEMAAPGRGATTRAVPVAGLSWVSVHPDHRRRGVLTSLIRHHLHGLHEGGGEAVSGLFASEMEIYGRYGYGVAASAVSMTLPTGAALRPIPDTADVSTQMIPAAAEGAVALVQGIFEQAWGAGVGGMSRPEVATRKMLFDRPERHPGSEPQKLIVARREGRPTGYALIRRQMEWNHGVPTGKAAVLELVALDPASEQVLWSRLLNLDLITQVSTPFLGLDHPLLSWLADVRAAGATRSDGLWLRLVDVGRAMTARGYQHDVDVVLEVTDDLCPWNAGRWRLAAAGTEVSCERTTADAGVRLDVRELASAYLGGPSVAALAAAGLVLEEQPGAVAALSGAMRGLAEPGVPPMF